MDLQTLYDMREELETIVFGLRDAVEACKNITKMNCWLDLESMETILTNDLERFEADLEYVNDDINSAEEDERRSQLIREALY